MSVKHTKGHSMKLLISIVISFALGGVTVYFFLGKAFSTFNQMSYETNLETTIKYLELVEEGKIEPLKQLLKSGVDCGSNVYKHFLKDDWENTAYSKKILEKAKPYIGTVDGCSKDLSKDV